jgi:hypothetical protein
MLEKSIISVVDLGILGFRNFKIYAVPQFLNSLRERRLNFGNPFIDY